MRTLPGRRFKKSSRRNVLSVDLCGKIRGEGSDDMVKFGVLGGIRNWAVETTLPGRKTKMAATSG